MIYKKLLEKRVLKQSSTFSVNLIISIMLLIDSGESDLNRLFLCHILFCIFARARWTDHVHISKWELDEDPDEIFNCGFLTGETLRAKTSISAQQRRMFLPLTAVLWTFLPPGKQKWWNVWDSLRQKFQLEIGQHTPFFPAPAISGGFCKRALTAGEASAWLREICMFHGLPCAGLSSQGCKATLLSWCAKAGVEPGVRLTLGYHVGASSNTLLHYSRDAQAGPLAQLNSVIRDVVLGRFRPDLPRSRYFLKPTEPAVLPASKRMKLSQRPSLWPDSIEISSQEDGFGDPIKQELQSSDHVQNFEDPFEGAGGSEVADVDNHDGGELPSVSHVPITQAMLDADRLRDFADISSSDDSGDSDSSSVELDGGQELPSLSGPSAGRAQAASGGDDLYVHKRFATVHKASVVRHDRLACGRLLSPIYKPSPGPSSEWVKCKICFGTAPK